MSKSTRGAEESPGPLVEFRGALCLCPGLGLLKPTLNLPGTKPKQSPESLSGSSYAKLVVILKELRLIRRSFYGVPVLGC